MQEAGLSGNAPELYYASVTTVLTWHLKEIYINSPSSNKYRRRHLSQEEASFTLSFENYLVLDTLTFTIRGESLMFQDCFYSTARALKNKHDKTHL